MSKVPIHFLAAKLRKRNENRKTSGKKTIHTPAAPATFPTSTSEVLPLRQSRAPAQTARDLQSNREEPPHKQRRTSTRTDKDLQTSRYEGHRINNAIKNALITHD